MADLLITLIGILCISENLSYLRNGAMVKEGYLPRERGYLLIMLTAASYFRLRCFEEAILARLEHSVD